MKLNRNVGLLVLAAASIGSVALSESPAPRRPRPPPPQPPRPPPHLPGHKWHGRHHGGMLLGITLRATKQLNLTAEQQASIKSIMANARAQMKAAHASGQAPVDMSVLGNPGDANYATALQSAKTLAATRIQQESELQGQIYNVLTAQQKAQLPTVLASMKAQAEERRQQWEQNHATSNSSAG